MRAVNRTPLLRIALLAFAVLFAHTGHAATRPLVYHPSIVKVAATRTESEKKLSLVLTRLVRPARPAHRHTLFGGSFDAAAGHRATVPSLQNAGQLTAARPAAYIRPQRSPFDLRI